MVYRLRFMHRGYPNKKRREYVLENKMLFQFTDDARTCRVHSTGTTKKTGAREQHIDALCRTLFMHRVQATNERRQGVLEN